MARAAGRSLAGRRCIICALKLVLVAWECRKPAMHARLGAAAAGAAGAFGSGCTQRLSLSPAAPPAPHPASQLSLSSIMSQNMFASAWGQAAKQGRSCSEKGCAPPRGWSIPRPPAWAKNWVRIVRERGEWAQVGQGVGAGGVRGRARGPGACKVASGCQGWGRRRRHGGEYKSIAWGSRIKKPNETGG